MKIVFRKVIDLRSIYLLKIWSSKTKGLEPCTRILFHKILVLVVRIKKQESCSCFLFQYCKFYSIELCFKTISIFLFVTNSYKNIMYDDFFDKVYYKAYIDLSWTYMFKIYSHRSIFLDKICIKKTVKSILLIVSLCARNESFNPEDNVD